MSNQTLGELREQTLCPSRLKTERKDAKTRGRLSSPCWNSVKKPLCSPVTGTSTVVKSLSQRRKGAKKEYPFVVLGVKTLCSLWLNFERVTPVKSSLREFHGVK
jgi:hypothetical protein